MNADFWKGKRVLITGHTGFKGSWLCLWLQSLYAKVYGYSTKPPTTPSLYEVAGVRDGLTESYEADVRDLKMLTEVFERHQPEIVFHMAAQPLVRYSYQNPIETYQTNVMGTLHLLEAIRRVGGVGAFINVTSDKCYENKEWIWPYRENEPLGGYDPYSNSKACSELVTAAYRDSFFNSEDYDRHRTAIATVRAGNVIGGGDWATDRLIPDIFSSFLQKKSVVIRMPHAIRPWQHVLDPLYGYLILAERLWLDGCQYAGAWNFGPNEEDSRTVEWIVERLSKMLDGNLIWEQESSNKNPHEAVYLKLDCSKSKSKLGWVPRWKLPCALERIVEWYRAYQADLDMKNICLDQIENYSLPGKQHV